MKVKETSFGILSILGNLTPSSGWFRILGNEAPSKSPTIFYNWNYRLDQGHLCQLE